MKIVAVIQARMASTRLPGKVLQQFHKMPVITWITETCARVSAIHTTVVATSTNPENDVIQELCDEYGLHCYRGSEDDVLSRYADIIGKYNADAVVRLTGDCPLADAGVIAQVIALYKATGVDYASNTEPPTWPDGLDCEVISANAIRAAHEEATRQTDRDCVTRWIVRNRHRFPAANLSCPLPGLHKERWVLDSKEDLAFMAAVFDHFGFMWRPNYIELLDYLNSAPHIRDFNKYLARNERFYESLRFDVLCERTFATSSRLFGQAEVLIPTAAQTFSKSHLQFPEGESPLFLSHGDGGYCYDVDGNDYVDMVGALLPNVLGYRDPDVDWAIRNQLNSGIGLSLSTELEYELAALLVKHIPCAEMVKFGKSGSDVTSAAIRIATACGLKKAHNAAIFKVQNHYHGWHDWAVAGTSRNTGVVVAPVVMVEPDGIERMFKSVQCPAGIILEPEGWSKEKLTALRNLCDKYGTLLIFDEVITGFRCDLGGYQKYIGVTPDLACFGKAMGNGMPISAIVGKAEYMKRFAPPDNIFYSGTFFGETLSLAAAIATIKKLEHENIIDQFWKRGGHLKDEAQKRIIEAGVSEHIEITGDAPLARIKFKGSQADQVKALFIKSMIQAGVLIIASHNLCAAHGENEIKIVLNAYDEALDTIREAIKHNRLPNATIKAASVRS